MAYSSGERIEAALVPETLPVQAGAQPLWADTKVSGGWGASLEKAGLPDE